jgi:hypothetical protein
MATQPSSTRLQGGHGIISHHLQASIHTTSMLPLPVGCWQLQQRHPLELHKTKATWLAQKQLINLNNVQINGSRLNVQLAMLCSWCVQQAPRQATVSILKAWPACQATSTSMAAAAARQGCHVGPVCLSGAPPHLLQQTSCTATGSTWHSDAPGRANVQAVRRPQWAHALVLVRTRSRRTVPSLQ